MFSKPAKKPSIINDISAIGLVSKNLSRVSPNITETIMAATSSDEIR